MNRIAITGLYGLKTAKAYDFSRNIAETTHHQFHFCRYENGEPKQVWEGIVEDNALFNILKDHSLLEEKEV